MFTPRLVRTTTFRLSAAYAAVFALGVLLLLGLVYLQTADVLSRRVDRILRAEADALGRTSPQIILEVIRQQSARDPLAAFALFSQTGEHVAGESRLQLADLPPTGEPRTVETSSAGAPLRALETRLPWGEILIVQRDTRQLVDLRRTILGALLVSGALILGFGAVCAVGLSLEPLSRVQATQQAVDAIKAGDLTVRLPSDGRGDEIDELARIVNGMMDEVERLMLQARTVGEGVAHELRTPLTRLRTTLDHAADSLGGDPRQALVERCILEADALLLRFRGLLRIAAVEARGRRAGIAPVSLNEVLEQTLELFQPLAEEAQISLALVCSASVTVDGDAELLVELFSNLIDNAVKFTPPGGGVEIRLQTAGEAGWVRVRDSGPGISASERALVLQRFYRSQTTAGIAGHGLGLSLVAAIADLHDFGLTFRDGSPGLEVEVRFPLHSGARA